MKKSKYFLTSTAGFTLIEILLTVMIVALLAGSLTATFRAGLKLERETKKSFRDLDEQRLIVEQMYKDFGRIINFDFKGSFPERKSFMFEKGMITFLIEDSGELKWVRYQLSAQSKGQIKETRLGRVTKKNVAVSNVTTTESGLLNLVREENDFVDPFDQSPAPQKSEVLSSRIMQDGFVVLVGMTSSDQKEIEWASTWKEGFLPTAIRMRVSLQSENGKSQEFSRDFLLPAGGRNAP